MTVFLGVSQGQIGDQYDLAIGYSPTGETCTMVGYVIKDATEWSEGTDITDTQRLIQIASPSSTDRFTFFPKVSQGDWSGGERQVFFEEATRYYQTDGEVETGIPGSLQLTSAKLVVDLPAPLDNGPHPVGTDGSFIYAAHYTATPTNLSIIDKTGAIVASVNVGGATPATKVYDIIPISTGNPAVQGSVLVRVAFGTYSVDSAGTIVQWNNDHVYGTAGPPRWTGSMMGIAGNRLYYGAGSGGGGLINPMTWIASNTTPLGAAAGAVEHTLPVVQGGISVLTAGGPGVVFATESSPFSVGITPGGIVDALSHIWTYDGATAVQVATIPGSVMQMRSALGVTYIVAVLQQPSTTTNYNLNYTLYSLSGSTLSVLDDLRPPKTSLDFLAGTLSTHNGIPPTASTAVMDWVGMWDDGTYLYVGWPGLRTMRYNLATGAVSEFGDFLYVGGAVHSHGVVGTSFGLVESIFEKSTPLQRLAIFNGVGPATLRQGRLTTSYYDFGTPNDTKVFRAVQFELDEVMPTGAQVQCEYRLDNVTTWNPTTVVVTNQKDLTAYLPIGNTPPAGNKGSRIQLRNTLVSTAAGVSPRVRSYSINARLGRTWKLTLMCYRNQKLRNSQDDSQGVDSTGLLANLLNAYSVTDGKCYLYVPSPTVAGATELVPAVLQEYTWRSQRPGPYSTDQTSQLCEGEIDVVLTEWEG